MSQVPYKDLIGTRYLYGGRELQDGLDCLGACRIVLARTFPDFDPVELPSSQEEIEAAIAGPKVLTRWRRIGTSIFDAGWVGDLVQVFSARGPGLLVLADSDTRTFVTSLPACGVCEMSIGTVARENKPGGVYRRAAS